MTEALSEQAAGARHGSRASVERAAQASDGSRRSSPDPLAAVFALGERAARVGAIVGLGLALTTHGALSGKAIASGALREIRAMTREMRTQIHDFLWTTYEIEAPKQDAPKPPPEPEPEPEPKVVEPANAPPPPVDPYEPPPAAAAAPKVLTQEPDPNEIVDMTSFGIASGTGDGPGYGMVAAEGTAKKPTYNPNAKVGGVPGGKGSGEPRPPPPPPPPPKRSLARAPDLLGSRSWNNCPFPPEADAEQIDQGQAVIMVTVRQDGTPSLVKVVSDSGYGFGRAARMCALRRRYTPGLDQDGRAITATLGPIRVGFTR
jgi:protein TonB